MESSPIADRSDQEHVDERRERRRELAPISSTTSGPFTATVDDRFPFANSHRGHRSPGGLYRIIDLPRRAFTGFERALHPPAVPRRGVLSREVNRSLGASDVWLEVPHVARARH